MSRNITVDTIKSNYSEEMNDALLRSVFTYANMYGLTTAKLSDMLAVLYANSICTLADIISFDEDKSYNVLPGFGSDDFHKFRDFSKIMSMISDGEREGTETLSLEMAVYIFTGLMLEEGKVSPRTYYNIAARGGIETLGELASRSYEEVQGIRGAGRLAMQFFDRMLKFYKLDWSTKLKSKESKKYSLADTIYHNKELDSTAKTIKIEVRDIPDASQSGSYYTLANKSGLTYGKYNNMFAALAAVQESNKTPGFDYDRVLMFETTVTCKEIILK